MLDSTLEAASFVRSLRPPMVVDLVTTLVSLARECSDDAGRSGTAAECRPSSPSFGLDCVTDGDACDGGDETMVAGGVVRRLLIGPFSDCHEVDMFLY